MAVDLRSTKGRVIKARTGLLLDEPFFGALALRLVLVEDPTCDTMWVDGVHLGYNPKEVATWSDEELKATICHEILHVANGHCWRRGGRDHEDWNKACDYAINPIVVDGGFKLPGWVLLDPTYRGQCAEQVYDTIHRPKMDDASDPSAGQDDDDTSDDQSQAPGAQGEDDEDTDDTQDQKSGSDAGNDDDQDDDQGDDQAEGGSASDDDEEGEGDGNSKDADDAKNEGSGAGAGDNDDDDDGKSDNAGNSDGGGGGGNADTDPTPSQPQRAGEVRDAPADVSPKELENEWRVAIDQAAKAASMRGNLPGNLKRVVEEVLKPSVDWRDVMRQFIQQSWAASDYSWRKPNLRYLSQALYLPHLASETIPCVIFVTDTSASIWGRLLAQFQAEVIAVVDEHKPEETYLVYADAAVQKVDRFEAGEPVEFNHVGGGGTDFRPVFEWVKQQGLTPTCLVYLTDLDGVFPTEQPDYPVLWVSPSTPFKAPWGDHIEMRY